MSDIEVRHWNEKTDGPLDQSTMKKKLENEGYRVSTYTYSPGTYFDNHEHRVSKIDAVLSGTFRIGMNGKFINLEAGDWIEVPAGVVHSAEVLGKVPVVSLDAVKLID
tara:strand:- start:2310 stop:2633 length:324 start_codon:yes stop_codon:yes gene_type:complete